MAWGSDTAATQLTSITTEQFFNQVPTLNPRETAHVQVSVDFPSSPTDHALVAVYTTLDDTSEVWDIIPMMEFLIENTTDPNRISFLVTGVYKFRVGVRRSGSTDTITSRRPEPPQGRRQRLGAQMAINPVWPKPPQVADPAPGSCDPGQRWVWHTRPRFILPAWEARRRGHCTALPSPALRPGQSA